MLRVILLCFIAISLVNSFNCSETFNVTALDYNCSYRVDYGSEADCTQLTFKSCKLDSHNHSQPSFLLYSQEESNKYCCLSPNPSNPFCSTVSSSNSNNYVIVILCLSMFIFLTIALVCLYRFQDDCCYCFRRCFRRNNGIINSYPTVSLINDTQSNLQHLGSKKWESDQNKLQTCECSVCLCQNPNFQLPCGHMFHQECILQCFRRRFECILCRRKELGLFKLYCRKCFRKHKNIFYYELKQLEKDQEKLCDTCSESDRMKAQILQ